MLQDWAAKIGRPERHKPLILISAQLQADADDWE
jgi:hypothetical protein